MRDLGQLSLVLGLFAFMVSIVALEFKKQVT